MATEPTQITGRCHCGNVRFVLHTDKPPEALAVRACGCDFCRAHGALSTSDPEAPVRFAIRDPARVNRYRFGLKTADFLVCRDCGVYLGAVMDDGGEAFAIINVNACEDRDRFTQLAAPMDYGGEDEAGRRARRRARWSPAEIVVESGLSGSGNSA
jgi:hypothetical protein